MVRHNLPISVITACRNCDEYIGQTISSIIGQQYQNLQYVLVEGASTDSTLEIVNHYRNEINIIISEPDEGQYYGIQKGMRLASGEIMAWLNGDDMYYPWTFSVINNIFQKFPEVDWIIGQPSYMNRESQCIRISGNAGTAYPREFIRNGWFRKALAGYLQQESMFWRKRLWDKAGGLNLHYQYAADFELWTKFAEYADLCTVTIPLAIFRKRPSEQKSSTGKDKYEREVYEVCSNLKAPPLVWKIIANRGLAWEYLCRMLIWKKCKLITYSERTSGWVLTKNTIRPVSRASLAEVLLERQLQRGTRKL
jgi:glycosyltransferase involved in cell wall biosynthesis